MPTKYLTFRTDEPEKYESLKARFAEKGYELVFERIRHEGEARSPLEDLDPTIVGKTGNHYQGWINVHHYATGVLRVDLEPRLEARVDQTT